jgi:hypothetical protein
MFRYTPPWYLQLARNTTQSIGIFAPKLVAPPTHGFEAHGEAAFSHHTLDIAITQAEANIQPNTLGITSMGNR